MDQCKFCHASNEINKSFMQNKKKMFVLLHDALTSKLSDKMSVVFH